jgi:sulfur-oxidizing protein SoxY
MKLDQPTRRDLFIGGAAVLIATTVPRSAGAATPFVEAMKNFIGEAPAQAGRVKLDIPPISENGNSVNVIITVESPMTDADHVKTIGLFAEKNPYPDVARFHLKPSAGQAKVSTTIRLATSQRVSAVAIMSDGSAFTDEHEVLVTLSACLDGG